MREVHIKQNKVVAVTTLVGDQFWSYLERFLEENDCHILFGSIFIVNKREIPALRTYEKSDGTIVIFDLGKPILEVGMEVEKHSKLSRTERPKIDVRW